MHASVIGKAAVTLAVLLGSLGIVLYRQARAFEAHAELATLRQQVAVAGAERIDLERRVLVQMSRARVVPAAEQRLGMHMPHSTEQVILLAEDAS